MSDIWEHIVDFFSVMLYMNTLTLMNLCETLLKLIDSIIEIVILMIGLIIFIVSCYAIITKICPIRANEYDTTRDKLSRLTEKT